MPAFYAGLRKKSRKFIKFVHFTAQSYFNRRREGLFGDWHAEAVKLSLHTLRIEFGDPPGDKNGAESLPLKIWSANDRGYDTFQNSAFIDYAMKFLTSRPETQPDSHDLDLTNLALSILGIPRVAQQAMHAIYVKLNVQALSLTLSGQLANDSDFIPAGFPQTRTVIGVSVSYVAACLGLSETLKRSTVLQGSSSVDAKDPNRLTPLTYATVMGWSSTVALLLNMGGSVMESCKIFNPLRMLVLTLKTPDAFEVLGVSQKLVKPIPTLKTLDTIRL